MHLKSLLAYDVVEIFNRAVRSIDGMDNITIAHKPNYSGKGVFFDGLFEQDLRLGINDAATSCLMSLSYNDLHNLYCLGGYVKNYINNFSKYIEEKINKF